MVSFNDIRSMFDRAGASWSSRINSFGDGIMSEAKGGGGGDYLCSYIAGGMRALTSSQMVKDFSKQFARFGSVGGSSSGSRSAVSAGGAMVAGGLGTLGFTPPPVLATQVIQPFIPSGGMPMGSGAAAPAGGTSIHSRSSNKADKSDKTDAAKKSEEIDKIEKQYRKTLADRGYAEPLLGEVIKDSKTAADGDPDQLRRILSAVPSRKFTPPTTADDGAVSGKSVEAQQREWVNAFGKWHTEHIGKVGDDKVRSQIINDVAGIKSDTTYELTFDPPAKPEKGQKRYKVSDKKGDGDLEKGSSYIYYNENDKKWYYDAGMKRELPVAGETKSPGKTATITVPGASDCMDVTPDGTDTRSDGSIADRFKIGRATGKEASRISGSASGGYVYRLPDNTWAFKRADGSGEMMPAGVEYRNGRLFFSRGSGVLDPAFAGTPEKGVEYMAGLRKEEEGFKTQGAKQPELQKSQRQERGDKAIEDYRATIADSAAKNNLGMTYDADKNTLIITCKPEECFNVSKALDAGNKSRDAAERNEKRNAILKSLPADTKIYINPGNPPAAKDQVATGDFPAENIAIAIQSQTPHRLAVDGDVSLTSIAKTGTECEDAIVARLNTAIADAKKSKTTPNANEIDFTGAVKLPEGRIDSAAWERIRTAVSNANGNVQVNFANVTGMNDVEAAAQKKYKDERTNVELNNIAFVRVLEGYGAKVHFDGTNVVVECDPAHKAAVEAELEKATAAQKKEFNDGINKVLTDNPPATLKFKGEELSGTDKHKVLLEKVKAMPAAPKTAVGASKPAAAGAAPIQPGSDATNKFLQGNELAKSLAGHGCDLVYDDKKQPPELRIDVRKVNGSDFRKYVASVFTDAEKDDTGLGKVQQFNDGLSAALPPGTKIFFEGRELKIESDNYWGVLGAAVRSSKSTTPTPAVDATAPAAQKAPPSAPRKGTLKINEGYDFGGEGFAKATPDKLEENIYNMIVQEIEGSDVNNPSEIDLSGSYVHVLPGKLKDGAWDRIHVRLLKKYDGAMVKMPELITDDATFKQAYANNVLQSNPLVKKLADSGATVTYYRESNTVVVTCPPNKVDDAKKALEGEFSVDDVEGFNAAVPAGAEMTINGHSVKVQDKNYYGALETGLKHADENASHSLSGSIDLRDMIFEEGISHDKKRDRIVTALIARIFETAKKEGVGLRGLVDITHLNLPKNCGMTVEDWSFINKELDKFFSKEAPPVHFSFNRDEVIGQLAGK